jgi:chromosome segregation ATPase
VTLLDTLRPARTASRAAQPDTSDEQAAEPLLAGRHRGLAGVIALLLLAGVLALVFGPARGMRTDIVNVSDDLDASRDGIFLQLDTARTQLGIAEQSLQIQEQGLAVAVEVERETEVAAQSSQEILDQTREALALVREVTRALGPLDQLDDKIESVVANVEQTVRIAQQTLQVAERTLATGQQALAVAQDTLATLKRSEQIQRELLDTAQATLEEVREINRKIPGAPIFPTAPEPSPAAP